MKKVFTILHCIFIFSHMTSAQYKSGYAPVNGLNMYYEMHGAGFPLVLIHGGGSTIGTSFGRILPALAKTHQVIAVELQAHGRTADIDRPLSFEQDADDVAALLQHLDIPKADIFGFSNGGTTTLQIAVRHPQLVNKIIVASAMYKKEGAYPWFWDFMKNASFDDMPQLLKDEFLKINPNAEALRVMHDRDLHRMQNFKNMNEAEIRGIQATALILAGDNDVVTAEHAVEICRQIPNARLLIMPGGHGDWMGEISSLKKESGNKYPAVDFIEAFLKETSAR